MAKVIIPSPFRKHAEGRREVVIDAAKLGELMRELVVKYRGLSVMFDNPALLSIFINGNMLRAAPDQWDSVAVQDGDEVTLIIPIAGG